ncbi:MAG: Mur ligase family protein [Candidatus Beckwithbacteria bacterium]
MTHSLEIIYFLLLLKEILKCLYYWQLKEYRFDRFKDLLRTQPKRLYFLPSRYLLFPRLTLKIILLVYLSLYFSLFFHPILAYFLVPLIVSLVVIILKPLSDLFIDFLVFCAKIKLKVMPKSQLVIGITGSYAKTSTKEIISHILAAKYSVCKTPETKNTLIGVAITILKTLKPAHRIFVVEMGAYKPGEIKSICNLVKPTIGVLTGITSQHLSLFGSQEKLLLAKSELCQALPSKSLALFNGEDQAVRKIASNFPQLTQVFYTYPKTKYKTNLLGDYQQLNLQAGVLLARKLGIKTALIKKRLLSLPAFKTQLTRKLGVNRATIIDNTYNANPEGFKAAINFAKTLAFDKKILITSGIIELGEDSTKHHQAINRLAQPVFSQIYITKPNLIEFFPTAKLISDPKKLSLDYKTLVLLISRLPQKFIDQLC